MEKNMATLEKNESHPWKSKDKFTKLSFSFADSKYQPGEKEKVSVKLGDRATSYTVPQTALDISGQDGKITNNTEKTINYTLS